MLKAVAMVRKPDWVSWWQVGTVAMVLPMFLAVSGASSVSAEKSRQVSPVKKLTSIGLSPQLLAQKERRTALVIGNGAYGAEGKLINPPNDATDVAQALRGLGFEVTLLKDVGQQQMDEAIEQFSSQLSQGGGVGLFYYAGHGVQVSEENYLIPIGAKIRSETDVRYKTIPLGKVMGKMEDAGNSVNIVVIDACRDNPSIRRFKRSGSRGLAPLQREPEGMLIAFATAPGEVADDGDGRNSPYTASLLKYLQEPGVPLPLLFERVGKSVREKTKGQQRPRYISSGIEYTFKPTTTFPPIAVANPTIQPAINPDLFNGSNSTPSNESPPTPQVSSPSSSQGSDAKQKRIVQQLRSVPLFTIADAQGAPLVANPPSGQKGLPVAGAFVDQKDAQNFLNVLKAKNPELAKNVKVVPVSLAEIYELIHPSGKPKSIDVAYVPSRQQFDAAQLLEQDEAAKSSNEIPQAANSFNEIPQAAAKSFNGTPLFFARSGKDKGYLTIQQDGKTIIPMFFNKEELQGLLDRFKQQKPTMASSIKIQVLSLESLLEKLRTINDPQLEQVVLFPPQESISFVKQK